VYNFLQSEVVYLIRYDIYYMIYDITSYYILHGMILHDMIYDMMYDTI